MFMEALKYAEEYRRTAASKVPQLLLETNHLSEIEMDSEIGRTPDLLGLRAAKAALGQVQPIDKGIDQAHRMLAGDIILQALRQEHGLRPIDSSEVSHIRASYRLPRRRESSELGNGGLKEVRVSAQASLPGQFRSDGRGCCRVSYGEAFTFTRRNRAA